MDRNDEQHRQLALISRRYDEQTNNDPVYSRKVLINKIDDKLKEYGKTSHFLLCIIERQGSQFAFGPDELVSRIRTYTSLDPPDSRIIRNVKSVMNWISDVKPLVREEGLFVYHTDDLVSLSNGQEYGWLDGAVEQSLDWILPRNIMNVRYNLPLVVYLNCCAM